MAAAAAGFCCCCCCLCSPPLQTFKSLAALLGPTQRGEAAFTAAISAGLLKPLSSLWSANFASSPSSRRRLTEEHWALFRVGPVAPRRTSYYREEDGGRPNRMVAEVYEQNGGSPQQEQEQERRPFPRRPVILWEKDRKGAFARFQGARGHCNNVAQLDAQSPQPRAGPSKWREAATMIEQSRYPSHKVVGGIESRQQNTGSLKVELKRVGNTKANLTRSNTANDVLEFREPEPLSREEEGQSSPISEGGVTENSVGQHLRTEVLHRGQ